MQELIEQLEDMGMPVTLLEDLPTDGTVSLEATMLAILKRIQSLEAQLELNSINPREEYSHVQPQG